MFYLLLEFQRANGKNEFHEFKRPPTAEAAMIAAQSIYDAALVENLSAQLWLEQAQLQLKRAKADFASSQADAQVWSASFDAMTHSTIDHKLLNIIGPNDTIEPSPENTSMPTVLKKWCFEFSHRSSTY